MYQDPKGDQWWLQTFNKFESSGLTKVGFCRSIKISKSHFLSMARKLRPDLVGTSSKYPKTNLADLADNITDKKFYPLLPNSQNIIIKVRGFTFEFEKLPDPSWFCHVIKHLEVGHV
jgi:hypothetical protein